MDNHPKEKMAHGNEEELNVDSSRNAETVDKAQLSEQNMTGHEEIKVNPNSIEEENKALNTDKVDERAFNTVQMKTFDQFNTEKPTMQISEDETSERMASKGKRFSQTWVKTGIIAFGLLIASCGVIFGFDLFAKEQLQTKSTGKKIAPVVEKTYKLVLTHSQKEYQLDLKTVGYDGQNINTIQEHQVRKWLDTVKKQVDKPAVNAQADKVGGPITKGKYGSYMDTEKMSGWLTDLTPFINQATEIPMVEKKPLVTSDDLKQVLNKQIGQYITKFDGSNVNRTTNIKLASQEINNIILLPGESFSFNKVVGERTVGRGYKSAGVIVKGEFSEGIGGGICQVSSTLFNSVDKAGLKITRRFSHSAEVTYVPPGRDATVSWGGPDFRFKNNLNKPVTIKINIGPNDMSIETFTVPGAKVRLKSVKDAPQSFTQTKVDNPDKPNEQLSQ